MASLVEELVTVLEEEEKIYQTLISYGEKKTDILIRADVPELEKLTCLEQLASDDLVTHSNQQVQLLKDIANVLGRTEEKMTVTRLITLLESQPDVQKKLTEARDRLLAAADRMNHLNDQNVALIKQAIELNEFDLTLFKSLRQAPETANYDKTACNTGSLLGSSGFEKNGKRIRKLIYWGIWTSECPVCTEYNGKQPCKCEHNRICPPAGSFCR